MRYLGGKHKIKKHILPIILGNRQPNQLYWEPFVGGANTFQDVENPRLGSDSNPYIIAMWKEVSNGWEPPDNLTVELYHRIKANPKEYPPHLVGFVGVGVTHSSRWFGTYASPERLNGRNIVKESKNSVIQSAPKLKGAIFHCSSYTNMAIPSNSLIYCDPPYKNSFQGYKDGNFNTDAFWGWAREVSKNNQIFVSEYEAPSNWICVWTASKATGLSNRIEKLWTLTKSNT